MKKITISETEARKIAESYGLGNLKFVKPISGGAVNYNFTLGTNQGDFVVRVLGRKKEEIDKRLQLEFDVLRYLQERNFSYGIPAPVLNSSGEPLSSFDGKRLWVYHKLAGRTIHQMNDEQLREVARAVATYHRVVSKFDYPGKIEQVDVRDVEGKYKQMREVKPKREVDRLMLANLNLFEMEIESVRNFRFDANPVLTHQDIHRDNVLFSGNKLTGILDFENLTFAPRINDIAYIVKSLLFHRDRHLDKRRFKIFLSAYQSVNPLTKKEIGAIIPWLTQYNCKMFADFYETCFDGKTSNEGCITWTINTAKGISEEMGLRKN